jgi:hypothetical protein
MRLDRADSEVVQVALSRRNLLALLAKLDGHPYRSSTTLLLPGTDKEPTLLVLAENDRAHYGKRGYGPGLMHPSTEAWLRESDLGGNEESGARPPGDPARGS